MTDRSDFADLMARISRRSHYAVDKRGVAYLDEDIVDGMFQECLAAIKTLVAERDAAQNDWMSARILADSLNDMLVSAIEYLGLEESSVPLVDAMKDREHAAHHTGWNEAREKAAQYVMLSPSCGGAILRTELRDGILALSPEPTR